MAQFNKPNKKPGTRHSRPDARKGSPHPSSRGRSSRKTASSSVAVPDNWIWGFHAIEACLETHPELLLEIQCDDKGHVDTASRRELLMNSARDARLAVKLVSALPKALQDKRTQGVVARLKSFPEMVLGEYIDHFKNELTEPTSRQWALLDGIQDPRNYGAILRSAAAFGVEGIFVRDRNQAPLTGVVAQASAGNVFRIPVIVCSNFNPVFESATQSNALVLGLDASGKDLEKLFSAQTQPQSQPQSQVKSSVLWVLGSEGEGIRHGLISKCSSLVKIDMSEGVESLNASAAATVAFYAARRWLMAP